MKSFLVALLTVCAFNLSAQDISIDAVNIPASATRYQSLTGTVSIKSTTALSQLIFAEVYFSKDNLLDASDYQGLFTSFSSINANQTKVLNLSGSFSQFGLNLEPGNYFIIVKADSKNTLSETDETNNAVVVPFTVLPASVDLTFQNTFLRDEPIGQGGVIYVSYTIKSLATDHVSSVVTEFYLTAGDAEGPRLLEWTYNYNALNWSDSTYAYQNLDVPTNFPQGTYSVYAKIRNIGQGLDIEETNTANNSAYFGEVNIIHATTDVGISDLIINGISHDSFMYNMALTNYDTVAIAGYGIKFTFSADDVLDASDDFTIELRYSTHSSRFLGGGQTKQLDDYISLYSPREWIPAGTWHVFAEINYERNFEEIDYSNNMILSENTITVDPYSISFNSPPTIDAVTHNSFTLHTSYESDMYNIYYLVVPAGSTAPDKATMLESPYVYPSEQKIVTGLESSTNYDVYLMGELHGGLTTELYKLPVSTPPGPEISVSRSSIAFKPVKVGSTAVQIYNVEAVLLDDSLKIEVVGDFLVSKDNVNFSKHAAMSAAEMNSGTSVKMYVKLLAADGTGVVDGRIIHSSLSAKAVEVTLTATFFNPKGGDFNNVSSVEDAGWEQLSKKGSQAWKLSTEAGPAGRTKGDDNKVIKINGAEGSVEENNDWLITPSLDLSTYTLTPELSFYSKSQGSGNTLQLKYSLDYVDGDPSSATWVDLNGDFPAANSNTWKLSSHITLPKNENVHVAFVYTSTATQASTWMVDSWNVSENLFSIESFTMDFDNTVSGAVSVAKEFEMQFVGYGDITIAATAGFEVSVDNETFTRELVIAANEMTASKTIYIRFAPTSSADLIEGKITISGVDFSVQRNVQGSSPAPMAIEKGGEKIFTLYPNPTSGNVSVEWHVPVAAGVAVKVISAQGIVVKHFRTTGNDFNTALSAFLENAPAGVYQVHVADGSRTFVTSVVRN